MTLDVRVERARCIGSKCCTHTAPGTFRLGRDNVATVVDPDGEPPEVVRQAAEECPTGAITVTETGPG